MSSRWHTSISAPDRAWLSFVGAWGLLTLLPFLPSLATPRPRSPYFPLCVEVLVLGTAVVYAHHTRWARATRIGAGLGVGVLLLYEAYDATVYVATRRSGILYEDLQYVDNLGYLLLNLWSWRMGALAVLALAGALGAARLVAWGLRTVARTGRYGGCRAALLAVHLGAWPLIVVVGPALELGPVNMTYQSSSERARVRTATTRAVANVQASLRLQTMLDSLQTAPVDSTYAGYDSLSLDRRPSIYLLMVESYGSALNTHPSLRAPYRALLRRTDSLLAADGWHRATARSDVPVRGGRSWLSIASFLTGTRVGHQLLFNQFQAAADDESNRKAPHLVRFLDDQGYRTVALQPFVFERPGLPVRNLYDFDVPLYRDDLNYEGPSYGLADAPDQYSLQYAHETQLRATDEPFVLFFETVDSHSLWNYGLPPYLDDWRQFNQQTEPPRSPPSNTASAPPVFLPDSLTTPLIYDQPTPLRYLRHVAHELRVLREYLIENAPPGSLVLLLGDHQPPLIDSADRTVPLHVLSTDSTLVARAREQGFTDGLRPSLTGRTLRQEGLYSFLVRLLVAHDRGTAPTDTTGLPALQPRGLPPSLLMQ
ncbi:hypothetical protein [Salinibacter altiplanensis]|uniref:hypothetical protein n=1 Tax=Salinibacter altiplanensis TaxID=1803181 RepID=UPI000C9F24A3|nr:hypothetical protein [Salinibacter altiplanensis]